MNSFTLDDMWLVLIVQVSNKEFLYVNATFPPDTFVFHEKSWEAFFFHLSWLEKEVLDEKELFEDNDVFDGEDQVEPTAWSCLSTWE